MGWSGQGQLLREADEYAVFMLVGEFVKGNECSLMSSGRKKKNFFFKNMYYNSPRS